MAVVLAKRLTEVTVYQPARPRQYRIGQNRENAPHSGKVDDIQLLRRGIPEINNLSALGSKAVLEQSQALIVEIGAAKIDLSRPSFFALLDELPKQKWHPGQMVEPLVGAAVLVNDITAMAQRQDRRDWLTLFECNPYRKIRTQALNQIAKPRPRLRQKAMTPPRDHHQTVEIIKQRVGSAGFIREALALGPLDSPPNRALVQPLEDLLKRLRQVQGVEQECLARLHRTRGGNLRRERPQFNVFPAVPSSFCLH